VAYAACEFISEESAQSSIYLPATPVFFRRVSKFAGMRSQKSARIIEAARSPIITQGAIVFPVVTLGMTEPSAMRKRWMPWTLSAPSTTDILSHPIFAEAA
jgi:hypothetical protein